MAPDVRKSLEIRSAVLVASRIVPERHRHTRERCRADELTGPTVERPALVVKNLDLHAEPAPLQLAAPDGTRGHAEGKAGNNVRAAADTAQTHVALHVPIDV